MATAAQNPLPKQADWRNNLWETIGVRKGAEDRKYRYSDEETLPSDHLLKGLAVGWMQKESPEAYNGLRGKEWNEAIRLVVRGYKLGWKKPKLVENPRSQRGPFGEAYHAVAGVSSPLTKKAGEVWDSVTEVGSMADRKLGRVLRGNPSARWWAFVYKDNHLYSQSLHDTKKEADQELNKALVAAEKEHPNADIRGVVSNRGAKRNPAPEAVHRRVLRGNPVPVFTASVSYKADADNLKKHYEKEGYTVKIVKYSNSHYEVRVYERKPNSKRNPAPEAAHMYESFHGEPSTEVIEYVDDEKYHGNLAALGVLVEMKVETVTGLEVTLGFEAGEGSGRENPKQHYESYRRGYDAGEKNSGSGASEEAAYERTLKGTDKSKEAKMMAFVRGFNDGQAVLVRKMWEEKKRRNPRNWKTITKSDIGKYFEGFGEVLPQDVGKRYYIERDGGTTQYYVENDQQREKRLSGGGSRMVNPKKDKPARTAYGQGVLDAQRGFRADPGNLNWIDPNESNEKLNADYMRGYQDHHQNKVHDEWLVREKRKRNPDPISSSTVLLCSNEHGTQLYLVGGDQSLDLSALKLDADKWKKDQMVIGDVIEITYRTRKEFDDFKEIDYFHHFSEDTKGPVPELVYDRLNESLSLVGGQYVIKQPLLEMSVGIEN